ncbi:MAG: hypothetical protein COZ18_08385 [Flexibacter sp. CG_4_10_14_3_um_filter_32_15]|nr:MAG: hypothetical protein COZ18_08385 [Flexibacter sp. CG_4_10_14_3_um_filter_32_15]
MNLIDYFKHRNLIDSLMNLYAHIEIFSHCKSVLRKVDIINQRFKEISEIEKYSDYSRFLEDAREQTKTPEAIRKAILLLVGSICAALYQDKIDDKLSSTIFAFIIALKEKYHEPK